MAVQRGLKRDCSEEVLRELRPESAKLVQGKLLQLATRLEAKTDGRAYLLMGLPEGNSLLREIGCSSHCVEIAGLRRDAHPVEAKAQRPREGRQHAQDAFDGVGSVEDRLLTFLEVLVVGARKPFHQRGSPDCRAEKATGFAADQLGQIRVLLLRHRARAGGEGFRKIEEAELRGGVKRELLREARDMYAERGESLGELEGEVAVAGRVHAVGRRRVETQCARRDGTVEGKRRAGHGTGTERAEVHALT